ncbi:hypothetical protein SKAU_G00082750 [Synaphobranchus kaupii]|uniref:Sodium channel regulatory subunit beta-3 n=1 Tax=Synaphobranchus kaupii TaxID=118154 RepID=A0A9Q1FV89_SYNKA|nr:hypothetical protein SKAU_G00082750 [Synaphobranchus kaupii]
MVDGLKEGWLFQCVVQLTVASTGVVNDQGYITPLPSRCALSPVPLAVLCDGHDSEIAHVGERQQPLYASSSGGEAERCTGLSVHGQTTGGESPRGVSLTRTPKKMIQTRILLHSLSFLILVVRVSRPVCVEVASDTEAVKGKPMKLTCISCMKREEVNAETRVDWYYISSDNYEIPIYLYDGQPREVEGPYKGRLRWIGSKDLQDLSISFIKRETIINLVVREKAPRDTTALYSEIMMYVLLVFLTSWLVVEMIYCYRKISKSDEQTQDSATDYLAIPSENKENLGAPNNAVKEKRFLYVQSQWKVLKDP